MIDNNKLLSRDRVATGRNVVTIKRNLIKIDSLLKERLVLVKVRQGILRQQEQNRMRRQREEDLESLQSTSVQTDNSDKQGSNFLSGLIKSILGLTGIFLPQILRLLNFLKRIVDPIKNMAIATFKALSSFLKVGTMAVDKITDAFNFKGSTLKGLDETTITTKFNKFEFALNTFVNALLFAGAMQTLSSLPDIKSVQKFLKKFKKLPLTEGNKIPIDDKFLLKPAKASANALEKIFDLRNLQKPVETISVPIKDRRFRVNPKGRKINPEDGRFFAKRKPRVSTTPKVDAEILQEIFSLEKDVPVDEVYKFLNQNKLRSPSEIYRLATTAFESDLLNLASQVDAGDITETIYNRRVRDSVFVYESALSELSKYSTDIDELFNIAYKGKTLPQSFRFPLDDFLLKQKNLKRLIEDFDDALPISKKSLSITIDESKKILEQFNKPVGAAARSMFPTTMPDLIYPSMFERGRSALFQFGEFAKGIDKTMVDFATRQTSRVSKVIMSGPLKGLQEGAEKMLKRAVGETIGLIPFLGDLVGLLLDIYLFGEIPERAGYKAVGGILGGFVGALIGSFPPLIPFGGPIIGSIIGGIGGDILGGFVYDMVKGKQASVSKQDTGESIGKTTAKSTIKEQAIKSGLITFGKGGFTGKGDSRQLAGLVHHNEQVFDPDTTLAVRQNAPGFFEDLNRAKGFESLEVLRNFASYEGTQTAMAHFIPIPIPMPRKEVPPVIDMATGEVREDLVSSYHYARG